MILISYVTKHISWQLECFVGNPRRPDYMLINEKKEKLKDTN